MHDNAASLNADAILVRRVTPDDWAAWAHLYRQYAAFYHLTISDAVLARTWSWLLSDVHVEEGIVAQLGSGELVGLAHYRPFPKPLLGEDVGFLDDLFVAPEARGLGVGRRLLAEVSAIAQARGWPLVRWITADDNLTARRLYDDVSQATAWVTYDLKPAGGLASD